MREALMIGGAALAAVGVTLMSIPLGLVCVGLLMGVVAYLSE